MAKLAIEGRELVVHFAPAERLAALRKEVRVPLTAVRGAWVQPHAHEAVVTALFPKLAMFPEGSQARELASVTPNGLSPTSEQPWATRRHPLYSSPLRGC